MAKTRQIMTLAPDYDGNHYVVIHDSSAKTNQYKLYRKWYNRGWHRKKVAEYGDFDSIMFHLIQLKYQVLNLH